MITIRGKTITLQPLTLPQMGRVYSSMRVLASCDPPEAMYSGENLDHLLRVIAEAVRPHVPDVTTAEIEDAVDINNIERILLAISGRDVRQTHGAIGHV